MFACSLQTCFHRAPGEAISHLRGILATAIPGKAAASWSSRESAETDEGGAFTRSRRLALSQPGRLAVTCRGHCFGIHGPEHIPGTGPLRAAEGFSLLLLLSASPHPTPPIYFVLLAAKPKQCIHEVWELQPNGRAVVEGWGQQKLLPGPKQARGARGARAALARHRKGPSGDCGGTTRQGTKIIEGAQGCWPALSDQGRQPEVASGAGTKINQGSRGHE